MLKRRLKGVQVLALVLALMLMAVSCAGEAGKSTSTKTAVKTSDAATQTAATVTPEQTAATTGSEQTTAAGNQTAAATKTAATTAAGNQTATATAPAPTATPVPSVKGTKMIISKNSGKALSQDNEKAVTQIYSFSNAQRWTIEQSGDIIKIKNAQTSKYVEYKGGLAVLSSANDSDTQKWKIEMDAAGFCKLRNVSSAKLLMVNANNSLSIGSDSDSKRDYWRIMDVYKKDVAHSDASWLEGGFGVFTHLLPEASTRKLLANKHDAEAIAAQLHAVGASYYMLSVGQMSGYWNTPNKVYSSMVSYQPDGRYTTEDIITEMAQALKKYNIKLMVYVVPMSATGINNGKYSDPQDFGFDAAQGNSIAEFNMENAMLWSMVLQEWSDTYGDLVSGWWVDGCYPQCQFDSDIAALYANALKHGNPKAIVAFNKGIYLGPYVDAEDYTTGETDHPMGKNDAQAGNKANWLLPTGSTAPRFSTGVQWFELTYIGKWWLDPAIRYTPALWADYVYEVVKNKGAIALDVAHDTSNGYRFTDNAMKVLTAVGKKLGKIQ